MSPERIVQAHIESGHILACEDGKENWPAEYARAREVVIAALTQSLQELWYWPDGVELTIYEVYAEGPMRRDILCCSSLMQHDTGISVEALHDDGSYRQLEIPAWRAPYWRPIVLRTADEAMSATSLAESQTIHIHNVAEVMATGTGDRTAREVEAAAAGHWLDWPYVFASCRSAHIMLPHIPHARIRQLVDLRVGREHK